jgi:tellurite methyltransferase
MNGGYDDGYAECPCFWGKGPGSLVVLLLGLITHDKQLKILDAGCGEGKNAAAFAQRGHDVYAFDCSELALKNGQAAWPDVRINWAVGDVRETSFPPNSFDVVVAYGLFHCLSSEEIIDQTIDYLKRTTRIGGYHVVCAFNDRHQDLSAHPNFSPCLISHESYLARYGDWTIIHQTDSDLHDSHPHNSIPHVHALTRLIARRTGK